MSSNLKEYDNMPIQELRTEAKNLRRMTDEKIDKAVEEKVESIRDKLQYNYNVDKIYLLSEVVQELNINNTDIRKAKFACERINRISNQFNIFGTPKETLKVNSFDLDNIKDTMEDILYGVKQAEKKIEELEEWNRCLNN